MVSAWKKNKRTPQGENEKIKKKDVKITSIPEVFYGGSDPQIYHTPTEAAKKGVGKKAGAEFKKKKGKTMSGPRQKVGIFSNKKFLYIAGGVLFLIAIAIISWYYINQAYNLAGPQETTPTETTTTPEPVVEEVEETIEETPEPEEEFDDEVQVDEEVPTTTPSLDDEVSLDFPRIITTDNTDVDVDSLTDIEEEIFDTDSGNWDTDGDGYNDGHEVENLYSPSGFTPAKLIDSGLIREYINPYWQYRLYAPIGWEIAAVDSQSDQVLISAITGDYIEVRVVPKVPGSTFADWFAENANGEDFGEIEVFSSRFEVDGYKRSDDLVAYFDDNDRVFVIVYHPISSMITFRRVMVMVVQSFRPVMTGLALPEQEVLPSETTEQPATSLPDESILDTTTEEIATSSVTTT